MKATKQELLTPFEFGSQFYNFNELTSSSLKKVRKQNLSQIRHFLLNMLNIRGKVIPKNLELLSVSKHFNVQTDEVAYSIFYEGDFE